MNNEWDDYWAIKKNKKGNKKIYDFFAAVFRKVILQNRLDFFIEKNFSKGANVLHAGCGSGQVDTKAINHINITALDISENALKIYRQIHGEKAITIHGDIFQLPFQDDFFDGIYNLGVMEHFTELEISKILLEFKRVLKPDGKLIIFWPPKFGLSVLILDLIHFILNKIFQYKIKLHPDEITRLQSKKQAIIIFEKEGFQIIGYYFGFRDLFTQSVIVAKKSNQKA